MTDIHKRAAGIFAIRVEHATYNIALLGIQETVSLSAFTPIVQCALLVGNPGTGKTSISSNLLETYRTTNERTVAYVTTRIGAIYVEIPSPVTIDGIACVILRALKDPFPTAGSPMAKTERIVSTVNRIGTKLIILDEFHNLFHLATSKDVKEVRDWLRGLINNLRATLVLAGIPECTALIQGDQQLADRFAHRFTLKEIPLVEGNEGRLQQYLSGFSAQVPTYTGVSSCPSFSTKHDALRMLAITGANPRAISHMYMFAVLGALRDKAFDGHLTLAHFALAAENSYFEGRRLITHNPFELPDAALVQQLAGRI